MARAAAKPCVRSTLLSKMIGVIPADHAPASARPSKSSENAGATAITIKS